MRNTDLFDDYLTGRLSPQDKIDFDSKLNSDEEFKNDFLTHEIFIQRIQSVKKNQELKQLMDKIHNDEFGSTPVIPINTRFNYFKVAAVAAGISLLIFVGGISLYRLGFEKPNTTRYEELVKRTVQRMEKATLNLEKSNGATTPRINPPANFEATGFAISSNGFFITSLHSVKNADSVKIQNEEIGFITAEKVWEDPQLDVAVFKATESSIFEKMALPISFRMNQSELGEKVFTLGYPRETVVYAEGNVSASSGFDGDTTKYQLSMLINPGNSGSPVMDEKGNLIGIISGRNTSEQGVSYAVKSNYIFQMLKQIPDERLRKEIALNSKNGLRKFSRTEQIKKLKPFVFNVKVYATEG
jgi:serine protease Do